MINDSKVKELAEFCLQSGESYTKVAREHGIGVARMKRFLDAIKEEPEEEKPSGKLCLEDLKRQFAPKKNNPKTMGNEITITLQSGQTLVMSFAEPVVDVRKKGAIV